MRSVSKKRSRQRRSPEGIAYDNCLTAACNCLVCGRTDREKPPNWFAPFRYERAHLSAGSGRMVRCEDVRAVVILCALCHRLHRHECEGTHRIGCVEYQTISDANLLWVKRERDPEFWDWEFIVSKWIGAPPEPVEPVITHGVW